MAAYSLLLLSALEAHGPQRTAAYEALPKWRRPARRPSCQALVNLLRKQLTAQLGRPGADAPPLNLNRESVGEG